MKEIIAYIRPALAHRVIEALKQTGLTDLSVVHVKGIGSSEDPQGGEYDGEFVERSSNMLKFEIFCSHGDSERYVKVILEHARTGKSGDGAIFLTHIDRAIRIKTGEEGAV